jgi:dTMP kinase
VPDVQLLLRVPISVAAQRADRRAEADPTRCKDQFETDHGLQARCAAVYDGLATDGWLAPWAVLDNTTDGVAGAGGFSELVGLMLRG